jgi:ATP adenylyltransferase
MVADKVLAETENFVATPTIGSIVEGWILISPKRHYLCFGAISPHLDLEIRIIRELVVETLRERYPRVVTFEHGPATCASPVGCSVDHAHIHVVPTACVLHKGAQSEVAAPIEWQPVTGLSDARRAFSGGHDYLYVEEDGRALLAKDGGFGSQLFRKVIARHEGATEKFDWRKHYFEDHVRSTIDLFENSTSELLSNT